MSQNVNLKTISCLTCHADVDVDKNTQSAVCASCTTRIAGAPAKPATVSKEPKMTKSGQPRKRRGEGVKYVPSGFPRGWHFKKYYKHTDGKVYSKGKEVTDPALIKRLQG